MDLPVHGIDDWADTEGNMLDFVHGLDFGSHDDSIDDESVHDSLREDEGRETDNGSFTLVSSEKAVDEPSAEGGSLVLDKSEYSRALSGAMNNTKGVGSSLQQPWERGHMKFLFQEPMQLDFNCSLPPVLREKTVSAVEDKEVHKKLEHVDKRKKLYDKQPSFAYCVKCKPDLNYLDKKEADMKLAIGKIAALVAMSPQSFQIGRIVVEENELPEDCERAMIETVEVILSMKSPNTVNKRAGALLLYVKWFADNNRGNPFPVVEKDVAAYLFHLRRSGSFISRGASFREALRFAHYTLGLDGSLLACDSPRIKGAADIMLCQSGTWRPADPLLVSEVLHFHNILDGEQHPLLDRIAAGNILAMTYGRCRASDLAFIKHVHLDYGQDNGYLELGTQHHKSSRKATLKRKLLPIVIPVIGINKKNWVDTLLSLRTRAGLSTKNLDNEPWWPAPVEIDGDAIKWGNRPVASDEISAWMVETLKTAGSDRNISSHSAKVTCLSWLSKAGVPREDRDVLGRHVTILHGAGPLYARDLISAPMRKLEETIHQVASQTFLPDQNRSGMFTPVVNQSAPQTPGTQRQSGLQENCNVEKAGESEPQVKEETNQEVIHIDDSDDFEITISEASMSGNESDDSTNSEEEDEQLKAIAPTGQSVKQTPVFFEQGCLFFMHKKSKICHFRDKPLTIGGDVNFFECGRKLSANFEQIPSINVRSFKCSLCFKNRH